MRPCHASLYATAIGQMSWHFTAPCLQSVQSSAVRQESGPRRTEERQVGDNMFYSLEGPLDPLPAEGQMRTANLTGFPDLVRGLGADPRWILEHHGIDPRVIRDPDSYIDCKSLVDVLEYCSLSFNDALFGLRLA